MDNSNSETPEGNRISSSNSQPLKPTQTSTPLIPSPGQVIGADGSTSSVPTSTPAQPPNQPVSSQAVIGNVAPEPVPQQTSSKKWLLPTVVTVIVVVMIGLAAFFLVHSKHKENKNVSSQGSSQSSNNSLGIDTSSWKTYSDTLIAFKYPASWTLKQDPYAGGNNFIVTPSNSQLTAYFGEDGSTENAKTNNSKSYWQKAYNSDGLTKVVAENSDSVNGYDTYTVETEASTGSTTYSVVGKNSLKIVFYYPTNDKNNDTYEEIVKTIHIN